jgi:CHAT domain-containing protein/tetratricopeptide (TPR) repeat protein
MCIAFGSVLLAGCQRSAPTQVLARQCTAISSAPDARLLVPGSPTPGALMFTVEERGISVAASLDTSASQSASPVERVGTITLLADAPSSSHVVRLHVEDSRDIVGTVCVNAEVIRPAEQARIRAEQAFTRAGESVHASAWEAAFAQYLEAARRFDGLGLARRAAQARHAMAELAYLRFDRKRDSFALASEALGSYPAGTDPVHLGLLAALQAEALLDMPGRDIPSTESAVRERLAMAAGQLVRSPLGSRELPRLDIVTGLLEYQLNAPERAALLWNRGARRCRELRDWDCYAIGSQNLAWLAGETNNYATALSDYGDALRFLSPELDPKLVADIWDNVGLVQGTVGLVSASERSHAAAMREYARLGDCPGVRRSLAHAGHLLLQLGALGDARSDLVQAASLECGDLLAASAATPATGADAQGRGTRTLVARDAAVVRASRGDLCSHHIDAATLATDNKAVVFDALLGLSEALALESESAQAQHCLDAAENYAITPRMRVRLANARGAAFLEHNDARAARSNFEQALQIADQGHLPPAYEHRGLAQLGVVRSALASGNDPAVLNEALLALRSSVARADIDQTITALRLVAVAYRSSGRTTEAAHTLQVAANLIEALPLDDLDGEKRATYLATQHSVFTELTDLFASQAAASEPMGWDAFVTSERGRARSLRYAATQASRDVAATFDAPAERYQQLLHDVAQLASGDTAGPPEALIEAVDAAADHRRTASVPIDRNGLARTLSKLDATLVEYAAGSRDMFAFVVTAGEVSVVRLADRVAISSAASDLLEHLRDPETPAPTVRAAARRLASLILWPLQQHLTGHRVIFVAEDALHTVPFSLLPWSSAGDSELLVQRLETAVAPSALFLTGVHAGAAVAPQQPRIELIGDPVFGLADWRRECLQGKEAARRPTVRSERGISDWAESLPRLPGTRAEVSAVAKLARQARPSSQVEALVGCAAVPSALRAAADGRADLLHIATHARVDAQRPRLSALALTPDPAAEPMTSVFGLLDILSLKLNSRLVVLSACDTSRGRLLPGEGVLGPAQAFLQAGSAAVLASYWRIDDAKTADFMQRFYTYLLVGHQPAATALRRAQLDALRSSGSHDWAAFALYGWPDSSI